MPVRSLGAEPGRDVLTDIDVLSLDVDLRLRLSKSASECKSSPGQTGEVDRLLWLSGFRDYLHVDRAVLVRRALSSRGARLARDLEIDLVDEGTLTEREAANAWLPDRFAHIGGEECAAAERRAETQLGAVRAVRPGLTAFLRHGALLAKSHEALAAVVALGDAVRGAAVLPDMAGLVLAGHALMALIVASIQDASRIGTVSDEVLKTRLGLALTTGNPDDTYVLDVLSRADDLIRAEIDRLHREYKESAGAPRVEFEPASLRSLVGEQPDWLDRYIDFIHRLRSSVEAARDLLQTAELAVFDALVGGTAFQAEAFGHLFTREHRSLLLAAARMLSDAAGEPVAERLSGLGDLDWDRASPTVPDRRQSRSAASNTAAGLANETSRAQPRDAGEAAS